MKSTVASVSKWLFNFGLLIILAACFFGLPAARAGLTVDVHLYHDNFGYYFYPYLNSNTNLPDFPNGIYQIASPQIPTNGSRLIYVATNNTISECYNGDCGGGSYYGTYDTMIDGITNGLWSITVTNDTSTNLYFFAVQVTGLTSNIFGAPPQAVFPTSGQIDVPNQPLMQWTGPANWAGTLSVQDVFIDTNGYSSDVASESLPPNSASWTPGVVLPTGTNQFSVTYQSNVTALVTANQPTNTSSGQPISGWVSTATLEAHFGYGNSYNVTFTVGSSQGNLVANGGFETGDFTGWTDDGSGDVNTDPTAVHSGTYGAEYGPVGSLGYLSQTLSTTPGTTYLLSFWLDSPDGDTPNEFQVSWDGTTLLDETNLPAIGWTNIQFVVTATGPSTVLEFGFRDDPAYLGLDDVSVVPTQAGRLGGPVVHYDFDEGTVLAADVSGNNNNIVYAGNFGGSGPTISSDTEAGAGSASLDSGSYLIPTNQLLPTLAGSFSISLWVNTTQDNGDPYDYAFNGDGIISADVGGIANDLVPVALTGGQVAFNTGNPDGGYDDTINSSATVNDGLWHHVVVSRNQTTGEKNIYVDGVLDTSDFDTTNLLNDPQLLTIGAISDASNPDPSSPDYYGYNGYQGLLDDIQIYNRVLTSNEVSFLYNNPGATLGGATTNAPYPVDANLQLFITRSQDPDLGEIYGGSVSFNSVNPAPTTTNSVHSPHDYFYTKQYPGGGDGGGAILNSLDQVINEFTNGLWTIYINQGSPTQQVYSFQVAVAGLDTNILQAVKVFLPTNGAVNIATNPAYYWVGPSNFSTLQVDLLSGPIAALLVTATNWPSAPTLSYGSDRFDVNYTSNNFPGVTFTIPMDASSNLINSFAATVNLSSVAFDNFVVGAPAPLPVLLTNLSRVSGNVQFSFQTLAGRPHTIQARTNLAAGVWIDLTNFVGDGSLKQFTFPTTNPPVEFFRVTTQ